MIDTTDQQTPRPRFLYEDSVKMQRHLAKSQRCWDKANRHFDNDRLYERYAAKAEAAFSKAAQYSRVLNASDQFHDRVAS